MLKSRILLLTRRYGYNFGSSLQAYAMYRLLTEYSDSVTVADYDENNASIRWRFRGWFDGFFTVLFTVLVPLRWWKKNYWNYLKIRRAQIQKFQQYEKDCLALSTAKYRNSAHLKKHVAAYDAFVCGSDQIWCPLLWDPVFFLDFVSGEQKRKIAYAPSLGIPEIKSHQDEISTLVKDFHSVSVRESSGADILENLIGYRPPVVVDPTLLLNKKYWDAFAESDRYKLPEGPYIACYFLGKNIPGDFLRELQEATGYRIINLMTYRTMNQIHGEAMFPGPDGFVRYIAHAAAVCTDSFHATVFSLIFGRNFYTFRRFASGERLDQNTRLDTLLDTENVRKRFLYSDEHYFPEKFSEIDYAQFRDHLNRKLEKSRKFLDDAFDF